MDKSEIESHAEHVNREAKYANYYEVGYNEEEFLIKCGQFCPSTDRTYIHTLIVTSPCYAKRLLGVLMESIDQYEKAFGPSLKTERETLDESPSSEQPHE